MMKSVVLSALVVAAFSSAGAVSRFRRSDFQGCIDGDNQYPYGPIENYDNQDPCVESCRCDDDGHIKCKVEMCQETCPGGAQGITLPGQCCPICPSGCMHDDVFYGVGSAVQQDICETCICQANGNITCHSTMCPILTNCEIILKDGDCCPSCKTPEENLCHDADTGLHYGHRDTHHDDPCVEVSCVDGQVVREMKHCQPPRCPGNQTPQMRFKDGQCCPEVICPAGCTDEESQTWYPVGPVPSDNSCEQCECNANGNITCDHVMCTPLPCTDFIFAEGDCCPTCSSGCVTDDRRYHPVGPIETESPCRTCTCNENGTVSCQNEHCSVPYCIGHLEFIPNTCCPVCIPRTSAGENSADDRRARRVYF